MVGQRIVGPRKIAAGILAISVLTGLAIFAAASLSLSPPWQAPLPEDDDHPTRVISRGAW